MVTHWFHIKNAAFQHHEEAAVACARACALTVICSASQAAAGVSRVAGEVGHGAQAVEHAFDEAGGNPHHKEHELMNEGGLRLRDEGSAL